MANSLIYDNFCYVKEIKVAIRQKISTQFQHVSGLFAQLFCLKLKIKMNLYSSTIFFNLVKFCCTKNCIVIFKLQDFLFHEVNKLENKLKFIVLFCGHFLIFFI